ncbi:MAG: SDR family NAD(P)-dependent oxidoreductase [Flavobacteriales bacterium]
MNILVTGASRGIGFELVNHFLNQKHHVIAVSRSTKNLLNIDSEYLTVLEFDLMSDSYIELINVVKQKESLDIVINNAGSMLNKPFLQITNKELLDVYNVNLFAPFKIIRDLYPFLSTKAHVVNISSMGGIQSSVKFPGLSAYSSSKGALTILTECLAQEFNNTDIRFNGLALGAVQTQMLEQAFPEYKADLSAEKMAKFIYDFAVFQGAFFNGKVLPVSFSTP